MLYIVYFYGISTLGVSVGVFFYILQHGFLQKKNYLFVSFVVMILHFFCFFFIDKTSLRFRQHNNKSIFNKLKFHLQRLIAYFLSNFLHYITDPGMFCLTKIKG